MAKLGEAASSKFVGPTLPKAIRLFRSAVPGPDRANIELHIEYEDIAASAARRDFEDANASWRALFGACLDSPKPLLSVELLSEVSA